MSSQLALILCSLVVILLFAFDFKYERSVSHALWIPLFWMMIIGSRNVSQWFNQGGILTSPDQYLAGSPIDRSIFLGLTICGILILFKRKIIWSQIIFNNWWILLLFSYGGISILWSDFPFVSFKRFIKTSGNLVMILIILTDRNPLDALKTLIRRCSYVFIPFSIILIKYYPGIGRFYDRWSGGTLNTGVTLNKNELGTLLMICGFFFCWSLYTIWKERSDYFDIKKACLHVAFLVMITWLIVKADSATSLACLIVGICTLIGMELPIFKKNPKFVYFYIPLVVFALVFFQLLFNLYENLISTLGRDLTLTSRVEIWEELIEMDTDPLTGTGFESFWLGNRAEKLWEKYWWHPNQAHNGYLEVYLNQGWIGLFFLSGLVIFTYKNIIKRLTFNYSYGSFRMSVLLMILVYNYTEAGFKGLHFVFFIFLLIAFEYPILRNNDFVEDEKAIYENYPKRVPTKL